jgi:hypothetical protein
VSSPKNQKEKSLIFNPKKQNLDVLNTKLKRKKFLSYQGRIQDFKLGGGAHLKKLRRAEGGAKIFGVFRVKIHDFTPIKQITESPSYP